MYKEPPPEAQSEITDFFQPSGKDKKQVWLAIVKNAACMFSRVHAMDGFLGFKIFIIYLKCACLPEYGFYTCTTL